jgi:hypothetical protein
MLTLTGDEPCTPSGIPLVGSEPDLKDADAVALIQVLADIVEQICVTPAHVQHVEAA